MRDVAHALFLSEYAKIQALADEESRLRHALAKLNEQDVRERAPDFDADAAMRKLGADLVWSEFVARNRRSLNIELSNIVAQKLTRMKTVRRKFGRYSALDEIVTRVLRENSQKCHRRQERSIIDAGWQKKS